MPNDVTDSPADHAIRIAPLAVPAGLFTHVPAVPSAPPPKLTYRGGPLLSSVHVFTIFIGAAWAAAQTQIATELNGFFGAVLAGPLMDQLAEYNVGGHVIGHGQLAGTTTQAGIKPGKSVTDAWIQSTVRTLTRPGGPVPPPAPNLLYFVYLPPGVILVQGGAKSCQAFCGYHSDIAQTWFYAAMPYPNCNGCLGPLAALDALTSTSSHELCEAITDPVPGAGWYDNANGEIGDICSWQTRTLGSYTVQLEWSNATRSCR